MPEWVVALLGVGAGTGIAAVVRVWLIAKVTIWSLTADAEGRKHALAVLRILKPHLLGGSSESPAEPHKDELPPGPKDPPLVGPGGGGVDEP